MPNPLNHILRGVGTISTTISRSHVPNYLPILLCIVVVFRG